MSKGKLIVLEGIDGSGKSAQYRRLCARMEKRNIDYNHIVFPRYDKDSSALIRMYLSGQFGSRPGDVNSYAASTFYAVDRYASWKKVWGDYYQAGGLVLSDRYTTSNAVHQASKLPEDQWEGFFQWLFDFECSKLGLPFPDQVVYLDMPTEKAVELLRSREAATHTKGDIHEVDTDYLALCRRTALKAAQCLNWKKFPCLDEAGQLRFPEEIHRDIWAILAQIIK